MPVNHSGAAIEGPETTETILPPIPEVVWHQRPDTSPENAKIVITFKYTTFGIVQTNQTPQSSDKIHAKSQTLPVNENLHQKSGSNPELIKQNDSTSKPVPLFDISLNNQPEIHERGNDSSTNIVGDHNFPPLRLTVQQCEKMLVGDENRNVLYMPLSYTIVRKWKKEMLYVPLDFQNRPRKDPLVSFLAFAGSELERINQQAHTNMYKIDDPENVQI